MLCDKVTQQGWQIIFPEVLSQRVVSNMISSAIVKAGLMNESYTLFYLDLMFFVIKTTVSIAF